MSSTHATLASFRMDLSREDEQRQGLNEMVVPGVRNYPGFIAGTWTPDREAAISYVLITYDSAEAAGQMADNVRGNAENQRASGLELIEVRILEVVAVA